MVLPAHRVPDAKIEKFQQWLLKQQHIRNNGRYSNPSDIPTIDMRNGRRRFMPQFLFNWLPKQERRVSMWLAARAAISTYPSSMRSLLPKSILIDDHQWWQEVLYTPHLFASPQWTYKLFPSRSTNLHLPYLFSQAHRAIKLPSSFFNSTQEFVIALIANYEWRALAPINVEYWYRSISLSLRESCEFQGNMVVEYGGSDRFAWERR